MKNSKRTDIVITVVYIGLIFACLVAESNVFWALCVLLIYPTMLFVGYIIFIAIPRFLPEAYKVKRPPDWVFIVGASIFIVILILVKVIGDENGEPEDAIAPTPAPTEMAEPTPITKPVCECSYNKYNCSDFSNRAEAWECFNYCESLGKGDIHDLDRDNDGPCDSLR